MPNQPSYSGTSFKLISLILLVFALTAPAHTAEANEQNAKTLRFNISPNRRFSTQLSK